MYVCLCNGLTQRCVSGAISAGASDAHSVYSSLDCAPCCGRCQPMIEDMIDDHKGGEAGFFPGPLAMAIAE